MWNQYTRCHNFHTNLFQKKSVTYEIVGEEKVLRFVNHPTSFSMQVVDSQYFQMSIVFHRLAKWLFMEKTKYN